MIDNRIRLTATIRNSSPRGTNDHSQLINRDSPDQHPMSAITGLEDALGDCVKVGDYAALTTQDIDEIWDNEEV